MTLAVKGRTIEGFGPRLARIRKSRGLSQRELARRVGTSKRVLVYYESDGAQPPGAMLPELARALRVPVDELLGLKRFKDTTSPRTARLINRLRRIEELTPADQRVVLRTLDALLERSAGRRHSGNGNGAGG